MRMTRSRTWMLLATLGLSACMAEVADESELALEEEEIGEVSHALVATTTYAATGGRSDSVTQLFGIGRHRASLGDFASLGDDRLTRLKLPPASRTRICRDEGASGTGSTCQTVTNPTIWPTPWFSVTLGSVSFIDIEPIAIAFRNTGYSGVSEPLVYGQHRANNGQFATVGNDQTRSVYVPPGMRVRLCSDEGGLGGHGTNRCTTLQESANDVAWVGVSYAEVLPVVTAFKDSNLLGLAQNFSAGTWLASQGGLAPIGNGVISSLAVPHLLTVQVCNDDHADGTGSGDCRTVARSQLTLGALDNAVSFLKVLPFTIGSTTVSVNVQSGTSTGSVTSIPFGFKCTSGTCSASFLARSSVRLSATPAANTKVTWSGCDSVVSNVCEVFTSSARNVSVRFDAISCLEQCYSGCPTKEPYRSECISECLDQCN